MYNSSFLTNYQNEKSNSIAISNLNINITWAMVNVN